MSRQASLKTWARVWPLRIPADYGFVFFCQTLFLFASEFIKHLFTLVNEISWPSVSCQHCGQCGNVCAREVRFRSRLNSFVIYLHLLYGVIHRQKYTPYTVHVIYFESTAWLTVKPQCLHWYSGTINEIVKMPTVTTSQHFDDTSQPNWASEQRAF